MKYVPIFIIAFVDLEELTRNIKMLTEIYIEKCDIFGQFKTLNMQNRLPAVFQHHRLVLSCLLLFEIPQYSLMVREYLSLATENDYF